MKYFLFLSILIFGLSPLKAQEKTSGQSGDYFTVLQTKKSNTGEVKLYQDNRVNTLVNKHIQINEQSRPQGWRIVIYSGSGHDARSKGQQVRSHFMSLSYKERAYLIYNEPNFKVHVGNFRTKSEALKFYKDVMVEYPGAYIVKDQIEILSISE